MHIFTIIGLVAATLTTIAFLPQIIKTITTKKARDVSLAMYLTFLLGILLWLLYGILIYDVPLIIANTITSILLAVELFFKLRYE